jgi:hypothetical protein
MNRFSALSIDGEAESTSPFKAAMAKKKGLQPKAAAASAFKPVEVKKSQDININEFPSLGIAKKPTVNAWKSIDGIKKAAELPVPESKFKQGDGKQRIKTPPLDVSRYYEDPAYITVMSKTGVFFVEEDDEHVPTYLQEEVSGYNRNKGYELSYDEW